MLDVMLCYTIKFSATRGSKSSPSAELRLALQGAWTLSNSAKVLDIRQGAPLPVSLQLVARFSPLPPHIQYTLTNTLRPLHDYCNAMTAPFRGLPRRPPGSDPVGELSPWSQAWWPRNVARAHCPRPHAPQACAHKSYISPMVNGGVVCITPHTHAASHRYLMDRRLVCAVIVAAVRLAEELPANWPRGNFKAGCGNNKARPCSTEPRSQCWQGLCTRTSGWVSL